MPDKFPTHRRSNESTLEICRAEIVAMRKSAWPYRKIAAWLLSERRIAISHEGVRKFCLVRGIAKPSPRIESERPQSRTPVATEYEDVEEQQRFTYDDSKPISIHRK